MNVRLDKVRLLYDRGQPTARLVVRSREDLLKPLVCVISPVVFRHASDAVLIG